MRMKKYSWGLKELDDLTGGLQSILTMIFGETASGKTTLAAYIPIMRISIELKEKIGKRAKEAFGEIRKRQIKRLEELQARRRKLLEAARVAEEAGEKEAAARLRKKATETAQKIASLKKALQQTNKTPQNAEAKKRQLEHLRQREAQFEHAIAETEKEK